MDDSWGQGFKGEKAEFRPEGQKELYMDRMRVEEGALQIVSGSNTQGSLGWS